ncbi:ABC transporter permease, partial [Candidatus Woesearchaeota archaeon]|nr:ABC transporter permease [Candidatus Woesearchaeota archaeon]
MVLYKYFEIAAKSLLARKLRSWLTIIGIVIVVAAIVSLISIGQGMQEVIDEQFEKVGSNRIIISPGSIFFGPAGSELVSAQLTKDEVDFVKKIRGVEAAIGVVSKTTQVRFNGETKTITIFGVPIDSEAIKQIESIGFFEIEKGREFTQTDRYSAVLGNIIAYDTFEKNITVGKKIKINDETFTVVGIQKRAGTGIHDVIIRIPEDVARTLFDEPEIVSTIFVTAKDGFEVSEVAENIEVKLRKKRDVKEGEEDFTVQTAEQSIESFKTILGVVQTVLAGIAAISLLVGGVGIMTTTYTSVIERTKEIGLMKAIGAKQKDILTQFLIESVVLTLSGGIVG